MGLPENIDALLTMFEINADQLARVADVNPSSVARWRKGSQMRRSSLDKICAYFNLTEDDLLSTENGLAAKEHGRIPLESIGEDEREMVLILRKLGDKERKALLTVARSMRKGGSRKE